MIKALMIDVDARFFKNYDQRLHVFGLPLNILGCGSCGN